MKRIFKSTANRVIWQIVLPAVQQTLAWMIARLKVNFHNKTLLSLFLPGGCLIFAAEASWSIQDIGEGSSESRPRLTTRFQGLADWRWNCHQRTLEPELEALQEEVPKKKKSEARVLCIFACAFWHNLPGTPGTGLALASCSFLATGSRSSWPNLL